MTFMIFIIQLCHLSVRVIRNLLRQTESDTEQPSQALASFLFARHQNPMQLKCEIEVTNESLEQHFCCNVLTFAEALGIEKDVQSILHQHQLQSKYKDKTKTIMKT